MAPQPQDARPEAQRRCRERPSFTRESCKAFAGRRFLGDASLMRENYPPHLLWFSLALLLLANVFAPAATIDTWTKSTGTYVSNLNTNSPVIGNGTAGSANVTLISGSIGSYTLTSVGDNLTLTGNVTFTGLGGTLAHGFRWGLFNLNGSSTVNGWLGYVTQNSSGTSPGDLYERDAGNSGSWWSTTGATKDASATESSNATLLDGSYVLSLSLTLSAPNTISVAWSLMGTNVSYSLSGSYMDASPQTLTFTTVGIGNAGLTASEIDFSNMSVVYNAVPEPSISLLGLLGLGGLCCWRRRRTD